MLLQSRFLQPLSASVAITLSVIAIAAQTSITTVLPTPPMGFNNWARFMVNFNETLFTTTAGAMLSKGLLAAGYNRLNLDDGWMQHSRAQNGSLQWDTTLFPHGIPWLVKNVTSRGFQLGIYENSGIKTCGGYPGSQDYEELDAKTFSSWGIDFLKLDGCHVRTDNGQSNQEAFKSLYSLWHRVLSNLKNPLIFSISAPAYFSGSDEAFFKVDNRTDWHRVMKWSTLYGELARHSVDIAVVDNYPPDTHPDWYWQSIMKNYGYQVLLARYQQPGFYNDPDFLIPDERLLTLDEKKSHFALWASFSAPLIISAYIPDLSTEEVKYLTNKDIIAIDQDPLGLQATLVSQDGTFDVLTKSLSNGDRSLTVLNKGNMSACTSIQLERIGLINSGIYTVKDLWTGKETNVTGAIDIELGRHATAIYRFLNAPSTIPTGMIFNTPSVNTTSLKCLTASTPPALTFSNCIASDSQIWKVSSEGAIGPLSSQNMCITAGKNGTALQGCNGDANQHWIYHVSGNLKNVARENECLTERNSRASVGICGDQLDDQVFGLPSGVEVVRTS
jgi:alpha-galactosidase